MKQTILYIITVILLCGVTVSCQNEDDGEVAETVIMFFPFSGLENIIDMNIECMKTAIANRKGLSNQRIIVYKAIDRSMGALYEIKYTKGRCVDVQIADVSATFTSGGQVSNAVKLQSVLEKVKNVAPARSYSMIIGCHGSSWLPAGNSISNMNYSFAKKNVTAFGSASEPYQLDNSTLVEALNKSGIHLTYLLFDACYMASIEAAYDFRNICDYYIASQNEIMDYGVPYDKIGDALLRHDYQSVVNGFYDFYSNYFFEGGSFPYGSLSVINPHNLEPIAALIKIINAEYLVDVDLKKVQNMDGITPTIFFDLYDYFDKACSDATYRNALKAAIDQAVLYEKHTPEFYTYFSSTTHAPIKTACGLNISQPTRNRDAKPLLELNEWYKATNP